MKKLVLLLTAAFITCSLWAGDLKLEKEKATLKIQVPPLENLLSKDVTYKFIYPKELRHYIESNLNNYTREFCDVDGDVNDYPRRLLAKKIFGDIPTDYTFELITDGITPLVRIGAPYTSPDYKDGFVQDFQCTFPAKLKVYKGKELIHELVVDDGGQPYKVTLFDNYRLDPSNYQQPYVGFPSADALENALKAGSPTLKKFCFLAEYKLYCEIYNRACTALLNLYGEYSFKTTIPINIVNPKEASSYEDYNQYANELLSFLSTTTSFDAIKENNEKLKKSAEFFESYAKKENLDKNLKLACLKNAAISRILIGDINQAFLLIRDHDNIGLRVFGSLRSVLFDLFNVFSYRSYYQSFDEKKDVIESMTLNDYFEKELNARILADTQKQIADLAAVQERIKNKNATMDKRNIYGAQTIVNYKNGTYRSCYSNIVFYDLDANGNLSTSCGTHIKTYIHFPYGTTRFLGDIQSVITTAKDSSKNVFIPILITDNPIFNIKILCEYKFSINGFNVLVDRTAYSDNAFIIEPIANNPKRRGYRLSQIVSISECPSWISENKALKDAINAGSIKNTEEGLKKLLPLLQAEKLPLKEL